MGEPDAIVDFVGDAEILVTHLAPLSAPMLDAAAEAALVAVSRGGPVNIDMAGRRAARHPRRQCAGPQRQRRRRVHDRRHPRRDAHHHARPRGAAPRRVARRPLPRRPDRRGAVRADRRHHRLRRDRHAGGPAAARRSAARSSSADPYVQLQRERSHATASSMSTSTRCSPASDVVTLHARVTPETTGFIDRRRHSPA